MTETSDPRKLPDGRELSRWGRRVGALAIDWAASWLVVIAILQRAPDHINSWWVLLAYFVESAVGTAVIGASFGQLVLRLRVLRFDGRPLSLLMAMLRAALICLVIPPLVYKPDGRGLHDMAVGSGVFVLPRPN